MGYRCKETKKTGRILSRSSRQGSDVWIIEWDSDHTVSSINCHDIEKVIPAVEKDKNGVIEVKCAFDKWSMKWGGEPYGSGLQISFNHYPSEGMVVLYDGTQEDFLRLSQMFEMIGAAK